MKKAIGVRNSSWCTEVILEAQKGRETVEAVTEAERSLAFFFFFFNSHIGKS